MHDLLTLTIQDRSGMLLNTKAQTVSSFNQKGDFDILPGHANIISLIERRVVYKDEQGRSHEYKLNRALMKVNSNKVSVFLSV